MALRIAVIEDCGTDADYMERLLTEWARRRREGIRPERFPSAESFLFRYDEDKAWDILLLDIEMGAMNGMELAKRIRREDESVQIIFITGLPDFMAEGYEVSALHYLIKPVAEEKLSAVLDKAVCNIRRGEKQLWITFDRQTRRVPLRRITYIEAQKQYVAIHTDTEEYRMKASLTEMEQKLDERFLKCQRSFLVNLSHILEIHSDHVVLNDGSKVPISRGMAQTIGREIIRLF